MNKINKLSFFCVLVVLMNPSFALDKIFVVNLESGLIEVYNENGRRSAGAPVRLPHQRSRVANVDAWKLFRSPAGVWIDVLDVDGRLHRLETSSLNLVTADIVPRPTPTAVVSIPARGVTVVSDSSYDFSLFKSAQALYIRTVPMTSKIEYMSLSDDLGSVIAISDPRGRTPQLVEFNSNRWINNFIRQFDEPVQALATSVDLPTQTLFSVATKPVVGSSVRITTLLNRTPLIASFLLGGGQTHVLEFDPGTPFIWALIDTSVYRFNAGSPGGTNNIHIARSNIVDIAAPREGVLYILYDDKITKYTVVGGSEQTIVTFTDDNERYELEIGQTPFYDLSFPPRTKALLGRAKSAGAFGNLSLKCDLCKFAKSKEAEEDADKFLKRRKSKEPLTWDEIVEFLSAGKPDARAGAEAYLELVTGYDRIIPVSGQEKR